MPHAPVVVADATMVANWIGSIGQAVGAVGTFAAVAVALLVARRDGRRAAAELADRQAGQARLVVAETCFRGEWLIRTTNHSREPVFTVSVEAGWEAVEREGSPAVIAVLDPGRSIDRPAVTSADPGTTEATIAFLDAAGIQWCRRGHRPPERITSRPQDEHHRR